MALIKGCCFTGHRTIPSEKIPELRERLKKGVEYVYSTYGITDFYTGGALGFDTMAAEAVLACKLDNSRIRLIVAVPCRDQASRWNHADVLRYEQIKGRADEVIYLSEHYTSDCMHKRNRYMVEHSAVCICYLSKQSGGTAYTVDYARKNGLRIFNIAMAKRKG